jgi:Zn-dependent protease with chaperone function
MFASVLSFGFPAQALQSAAMFARPLFGLGFLATMLMMFKPMVVGVFQAIRLMFSPRLTLEERNNRRILQGVLMLNRMARDIEHFEPNQAAELRQLAGRC